MLICADDETPKHVTPARFGHKGFVEINRDGLWIELTHVEAHELLLVEPYNSDLYKAVQWADAVKWINEGIVFDDYR